MVLAQEVILCAVGPSAPGAGAGGIYVHDLQTGTTLASFKQTSANVHSTGIVQTQMGQGGLMLAAQPDKALVNVYNFQKDQIQLRIAIPERLSCFAVDKQGRFCAGGTAQGRLYIWEVASGILFNSFEAHYRAVSVACFSDDGSALATASEDSGVSIWAMSSILDNDLQQKLPVPYWMPTDHTLAVTDLQFGMGAFPNCRLFTCSLDETCKVWDIKTKSLLTTFVFPRPLTLLAVERTERTFFVASADGHIYQMNLFRQKRGAAHRAEMEAIGGGGSGEAIRLGEAEGGEDLRYMKSEQPLKSLAITLTSNLLLAGTTDGSILLYDIASHQLIRSFHAHKGYSINTLLTMLKPPDLIGHANLGFGTEKDQIPALACAPFQRVKDQKARERHDVQMMLLALEEPEPPLPTVYDHVLAQHEFFLSDMPSRALDGSGSVSTLQTRVSELEAEASRLRGQLGRVKGVNDAMWETVVKSVLSGAQKENGDVGADEGRRKRQRTAVV